MNKNMTFTDEQRENFWAYFDIADQLWPDPTDEYDWTVDDFEDRFVDQARAAARDLGLPWPPYRPTAEDFALDHKAVYA